VHIHHALTLEDYSARMAAIHALVPALPGNDDMTSSPRDPIVAPPDDEPDYQWAEYNLPAAMLDGIASVDDEDKLAFVCFSIDSDTAVPEGSQ
jgi:hypothetical protein